MILCIVLVVRAHLDGMPASGVQQALPRRAQMRGGSLGPTGGSEGGLLPGLLVTIIGPTSERDAVARSVLTTVDIDVLM